MSAVLARLKAAPTNWGLGVQDVRRAHRTAVPKAGAPAVHLVGGRDEPAREHSKSLCRRRNAEFTVALFVRNDAGESAADPLRIEAMRRLNPETTGLAAYPSGALVRPAEIDPDEEIADGDAIRIDMRFEFSYPATDWKLSQ